ncbi:Tetratricopeptide repeat-containing protein [[Clostridium] aminophilum]|uniref:Tetratricopeptide repeat-containing protein n=1 Tax=[Clostridium] aminophilum TaxID=1526 RepID=A0A1I0EB91_9FIRM|nr:leucine-rich repeat domain-containing protein [[Clostridium] aminophilum]SET41658.1 Tetratricopeptide repeat-containing protein [[Clostridium] aminophilum]
MKRKIVSQLALGFTIAGAVLWSGNIMNIFLGIARMNAKPAEKTISDYLGEGQKYLENDDYREAMVCYENAIAMDEQNPEAVSGLARTYEGTDNFRKAEAMYEKALELKPDDADTILSLAQAYIQNGKREEAKKLLAEKADSTRDDRIRQMLSQTDVESPVANLPSGNYDAYQVLTLDIPENAIVYYTTDGKKATSKSKIYEDGILITQPETHINAVAFNVYGYQSEPLSLDYTITAPNEPVSVNDPDLEMILRNASGRENGPLMTADLAGIRELYIIGPDAYEKKDSLRQYRFSEWEIRKTGETMRADDYQGDIRDYSSLRYCTNLTTLCIAYQDHPDLTAISSLSGLKNLSLMKNHLTDITPIAGLTGLEQLNLGWNDLTDIHAVSGLQTLTSLGIWGNHITDLSPLGSLTGLTYLDFSDNEVSDVSALEAMTDLKELWMAGNRLTDISVTDSMPYLEVLMAGGNSIENYGKLEKRLFDMNQTDLMEEK